MLMKFTIVGWCTKLKFKLALHDFSWQFIKNLVHNIHKYYQIQDLEIIKKWKGKEL